MSISRPHSRTASRPTLAPGARGRVYIFSVVVLALFFGCVVVWRQPPRSHTARVVIEQTGQHGQLNTKPAIVKEIFDIHHDHAAEGHFADGHSHDDHGTHHAHGHDPAQQIDPANQQPHLLVDVQQSDERKLITIWCAASQSEAAEAEAGSLARLYVERVATPGIETHPNPTQQQAKAASAQARGALQTAQSKLDAFLAKHPATRSPEGSGPSRSTSVTPPNANDVSKMKSTPHPPTEIILPQPNPAWVELDERLQVLRAARQELLVSKTEAHPQVRDLQWQVEKLEAEIALISPTLLPTDSNDEENAQPEVAPESIVPSTIVEDASQPSPERLAQINELQSAVTAARKALQQAQAHERRANSPTQSSNAMATIVEPATIVSTRGGGASRSAVFGGGLLAMLAGLLIAWGSQRIRQPAALISTMQIESLGMPVVAAISTGDGPAIPTPQISNPRWIAWLTFACELMVAAIAVSMLLLALSDWQTAGQMMNDPLSTFGEVVSRLW